jgi:ribonuclease HII
MSKMLEEEVNKEENNELLLNKSNEGAKIKKRKIVKGRGKTKLKIDEPALQLEECVEVEKEVAQAVKTTRTKKPMAVLQSSYYDDLSLMEMGVDEVGRGPLFGRVYSAAVILPKGEQFDHASMKDSKRFHSKKKIEAVADYIKEHAIAWAVCYEDEKTIDEINILQASQSAMHKCIGEVLKKMRNKDDSFTTNNMRLLIDGNYFNSYLYYNKSIGKAEVVNSVCIEGGDNKYSAIAAASILAKVERDKYIEDLCNDHPELKERYSLDSNKGYGSKKHIDGIKEYGITVWHRRSFGICKDYM